MILHELKKIVLYRKGIWFIGVYVLLHVISLFFLTEPYNKVIEENKASYNAYMEIMHGKLTQEKKEFIQTERVRLMEANSLIYNLQTEYYKGLIGEEEFLEQYQRLRADADALPGVEELFTQYIYARELPEERYILYSNGWEVLLSGQTPDYLLLILLVFLAVPVFCEEYQCDMDMLHKTTKKGANSQIFAKVLATVGVGAFVMLFSILLELFAYSVRFGLPDGNYTLQSLMSYSSAEKELTLWGAFALQSLLRLLGVVETMVLLLVISSTAKKYAVALLIGTAVLILPYLTCTDYTIFCRAPGPWGYLIGNLYLRGSGTGKELLLMVGVVLVVTLGLARVLWCENANYWVKRKKRSAGTVMMACICFMLFFSGCGKETSGEEEKVYNLNQRYMAETEMYYCYSMLTEEMGEICVLERKDTKEVWGLLRDPLEGITQGYSNSVYAEGEHIYFLAFEESREYKGYSRESHGHDSRMMVVGLDTKDMSTEYLYQKDININDQYFMGLRHQLVGNEATEILRNASDFFLEGNYAYIIKSGKMVYRLHLMSGILTELVELPSNCNVAYDGEFIYYVNHENEICRYSIGSEDIEILEGITTDEYTLTEDGLFFCNKKDEEKIYFWDKTTRDVKKIADVAGRNMIYDGMHLYFNSMNGNVYQGYLCRVEIATGKVELVLEQRTLRVVCFRDKEEIIVTVTGNDIETSGRWVIKKTTLEKEWFPATEEFLLY